MFRAPQTIPSSTNASALPDAPEISFDSRTPIGVSGSGGEGTRLTDVTRSVTKPNVVPETVDRNETADRVLVVGGKVQAAKLIHQVQPVYPVLARQTRAQGVVTLDAVIGADGSIQQLRLVSGHPLLTASAMQAVQQWRYSPTFLNGKAVEVHTTIEVRFTLSGF
jgi:protein TonB